jgi:anaerobic ribonucleoside-triphosphate reductase/glutaredoxin
MEMKIRKRDGSVATFDESKIAKAVKGAFSDLGRTVSDADLDFVVRRSVASLTPDKDGTVGVEDVQDKVEMALIDSGFKEVALQYARYREKHAQMRDGLDYGKLIDDYIGKNDWRVKENATVSFSLGGLILSNSGAVTANYWLNHIYDKEIADAHRNADLHIHDLSMLSAYCAGWSIKQLINEGLGGVQGKISSKPASHLMTLCNQMVNFLGCTQNEWAGAQAFSSFDTYLAPFVKADHLTYKEVKQAIQSFIYGVNTPSRWGTQAPFTNVTIDWKCPNDLKNLKAVVGGKEMDFTYGDCQKEMDMVNKAFIETMIEGDANGRGFQYPIPTYSITKDFDWSDTENNKLLFEMAAKYGIPYFSNYINSDMNPDDVRSMCCRLRLDLRELRKKNGGFFGAGESTGCYDEKTYVFTNHGWKLFKDVDDNDEVCTLSPANEIEFHKPDKKFVYDYDGEMVKISGEKIDLLVTPNHRMLYCDRYTDEHKFVRADSITRENYKIPASGHWTGKDSEFFVLPGIDTEFRTGEYDNLHKIEWEPVKIKMTSWLKFLGMFISEGSFDNDECAATHGYRVFISQVKEETKAIFDEALKELPFNYSYDGRAFVICNKQLWSYVRQFGLCYDKFIPDDIKELPSEKLKVLYDFLMYGDGSIRRKIESKRPNAIHQKVYYTVSEKLANDVREILIKIGCMSSVNVRQGRISEIKGRVITSASKQYEVCAYQGKNRYLTKRNIGKEKYTGKVYCCEVQNNTLLVKRNEKMCWCGNSIGVVTINMPRIGYLASDKDDFYKRLDHMMDIAARSLIIKRKVIAEFYAQGMYPYSKRYLGETGFKNHFSTIGLVGMNETCLNAKWIKHDLTNKDAQDFTVEVLNHMRNRLSDYQEQNPGVLFNLEATPAESTCVSGDTSVWTNKGLRTVNEIMADKNLSVLSYNESTGKTEFKKLFDCWKTKKNAEVMKITFSNGDGIKVTSNHKMAKKQEGKREIEYVEAGTLKVGDELLAHCGAWYHGGLSSEEVAKIEFLSEREDVYDLEVEGNHNFFISGGADDAVLVHNCYRLAKHDKERYPDIITAGKAGETPYYTNSSHLPVGYTEDIFSALDVEDRFQTLYTSGTVFHAFLGQRLPNWQSCMKLVRRIAENYKLPYFTMSPTYSVCPNHGYIAGEVYKCPVCGAETEVYSRITGYYRPLKNWNAGKTQEFHDRRTYRPSDPSVSPTDPSKTGQTDDWATRTDSSMTGRTDKTLTSTDGKTLECSCSTLDRTETDAKPEADNKKVDNEKVDAEAKSQASGRPMLFYSKTCPNCKMAHMLLDKAGIKYDDYDAYENQELAKKLCVSSAPTLLVPKGDGNFSVYANVSEIKGWIEGKNEW